MADDTPKQLAYARRQRDVARGQRDRLEAAWAESNRRLDTALEAIDAALAIFECKSPAGGLGPGTHCAACCYGTGYVITCEEDDRLVRTLTEARRAIASTTR